MHTNLVWVLDVKNFLCSMLPKIKYLPKHPTHGAVFDSKYIKLFDARPNAIRTFGLHIWRFLTVSNIDFSAI